MLAISKFQLHGGSRVLGGFSKSQDFPGLTLITLSASSGWAASVDVTDDKNTHHVARTRPPVRLKKLAFGKNM